MFLRLNFTLLLVLAAICLVEAQVVDTVINKSVDSLFNKQGGVQKIVTDGSGNQQFVLSKDAIDVPIEYGALDSMRLDVESRRIYLYGKGYVKYETNELTAPLIVLDAQSKIASAEPIRDTTGKIIDNPIFIEGGKEYRAESLKYNFDKKLGVVTNVLSKEEDMYVLSEKAKFVTKVDSITGESENIIYSKNALITTCPCEIGELPDYGIRSGKQKYYPDKRLAVIGPSYLEIMGIPTPLVLPFGFFPVGAKQKSGLLLPTNYEFSENWGFGFKDIGYYWAISDKMDLQLTGDIFTRGSWGLYEKMRYKKRYKYEGDVNLSYSVRKNGDSEALDFTQQNAFNFTWNHNQAAQAHPYNTFRANVNIQSNDFLSSNYNDASSVLTNTLRSNISFSRKLPHAPVSFSTSFDHSQNTQTHQVNFQFPQANLNVSRFSPFKSKSTNPSKLKWFEKINTSYSSSFSNSYATTDTTMFRDNILDNSQFNLTHRVPVSATYNIFKYFQFTPSFNYNEKWFFRSVEKRFDRDSVELATDGSVLNEFGSVSEEDVWGFNELRTFSSSASLSTRIYGRKYFKGDWLKGLSHVMTPSVSYNFSPDFSQDKWGYFDEVKAIKDGTSQTVDRYNIFENESGGGVSSSKSSSLQFNLSNIFEAKFKNRRDTTAKDHKIKLLNSLNFSGSYNFALEDTKWSTINMSANNTFFYNIFSARMNMTLDPYGFDATGGRDSKYKYDENGKFLMVKGASYNFTTSMSWAKGKEVFDKLFKKDAEIVSTTNEQENTPRTYLDDVIKTLTVSHNLNVRRSVSSILDTTTIAVNSISGAAQFDLTSKWTFKVRSLGYDFVGKSITYPDFSFYRDLNCWEMGMEWQPQRSTYQFFVRVKPSSLGFINVPYNQRNYDPTLTF